MKEKIEALIKEEFKTEDLVFEEKANELIVYQYIVPFIADNIQDDHKGQLVELMRVSIDSKDVIGTGILVGKTEFAKKIKQALV